MTDTTTKNGQKTLFEYAILHHRKPTKKEEEDGQRTVSKMIVEPTRILAKNEQEAMMVIAREIPQEYVERLDEVEVIVRPF